MPDVSAQEPTIDVRLVSRLGRTKAELNVLAGAEPRVDSGQGLRLIQNRFSLREPNGLLDRLVPEHLKRLVRGGTDVVLRRGEPVAAPAFVAREVRKFLLNVLEH